MTRADRAKRFCSGSMCSCERRLAGELLERIGIPCRLCVLHDMDKYSLLSTVYSLATLGDYSTAGRNQPREHRRRETREPKQGVAHVFV